MGEVPGAWDKRIARLEWRAGRSSMDRAAAPQSAIVLPYYGWYVLAASALSEMLAIGATSYSAGLFVLPLQAEFGISRANASSSVLILFLGAIFVAPYAGKLLDRYPIRLVMFAGAIIFSAALTIIALTSSIWVMTLALLVPAATGFMMLGPMTTATLASRWFFRRRGLALGIAAIATSGGGFVVVPALSKGIELFGWRSALLGEAVIVLSVVTLLALLVLKDNPFIAGFGEHPENKGRSDSALLLKSEGGGIRDETRHLRWRSILGNRGFWAPSLLIATVSGLSEAIVISAPPYGHQLGFTAAASAFLISAFSIAAALTKILTGVLADFWNKRYLLFGSAVCLPLSLVTLYYLGNYAAVFAACCLAGISLGGVLPTSSSVIATRFGAASFGSIMGWTYSLIAAFTILAVRFLGSIFDLTGSYRPAFAALLVISLFIWTAALFIDSRVIPAHP
jgi:MFS family permease